MIKRFATITIIMAILISAIPAVYANADAIDIDSKKGIAKISYKDNSRTVYRVLVRSGKKQVSYPFFANGKTEVFPLQFGNGEYTIGLLKQLANGKYAFVQSKKTTLNLKDPNIVYLNSIQNIKWNEKDKPIKFAKKRAAKLSLKAAKNVLSEFHKYITANVVYDWNKLPTLKPDYVPNIVETFKTNKGICYDYSSLLASFMRSNGFPTRLVKGYTNAVEGYHAWNEVLIDGKWYIIDSTVDAGLKVPAMKFKEEKDYKKVNDY